MCGFIGIYGPDGTDVATEIYEGLLAIQHRGQDAAGITTFTDQFHVKKGFGMVRDVFDEKNMSRLRGNLGIGHVRYPTVGTGTGDDAQPFHLTFPVGIAMAHNGNVTNFLELKETYFQSTGTRLNSSCDLEVILFVFASALRERVRAGHMVDMEDVFHSVSEVYRKVRGAYSVVMSMPDVGMIAFRDPYGIKPMVFGERLSEGGMSFAVTSESVVLDVIGYERTFDVGPGEVVFVGKDRKVVRRKLVEKEHRPCIFEMVYFARPDSMIDGISVYRTRMRSGVAMAHQWRETGAPMPDVVIPIPDSSREAALAMATELGVPYREGLVKNRYIGRTFIMPNQEDRKNSVRRKLNTIPLEFKDKNVLLVDDSVVRGNTAKRIVGMARDAGASKVYLASCSPPLVAPCPYGIDMATKTEFVASGRDAAQVAAELEADYMMYLDRDRLNAAAHAGNEKVTKFCNACFTGDYPTGDITAEVLQSIGGERTDNQGRLEFSSKG
jgi:amidophosphoribosyltransferase